VIKKNMDKINKITHKISVIMPVYNGAKYLDAAIHSVLKQSYSNFELLIIDDKSTDNSCLIIEKYLIDSRIIYLKNDENIGVAGSRNVALKHSCGQFIAFLDQDDIWLSRKLEIQLAVLNNHPELGLLHAFYTRIDEYDQLLPSWAKLDSNIFNNNCSDTKIDWVFEKLFISNDIQPLTSMIPKSVLDSVGWFNPALPGVDDYELWLRIAKCYPIGQVQTILGHWRKHQSQQSNLGWKMLELKINALDNVISSDQDIKRHLNRKVYVERMHPLVRSIGNYYFWRQDYSKALIYLQRALVLKYSDFDSIIKIAYCSIPNIFRQTFRRIKN